MKNDFLYQPFLADKKTISFLANLDFNNLEAQINLASDFKGGAKEVIAINGTMFRYENILTKLGYGVATENIKVQIKEALANNKEIILLFDSGGGLVSGTSDLANFIKANNDKITAFVKGTCASAAFWVASACKKIYAEDTSMIGSIGVVCSVSDYSEFYKRLGMQFKDVTSSNAENKRVDYFSEDGEKALKKELDSLEDIFISAICENRKLSKEEVINAGNKGGVITGKEAKEKGLIDEITSFDNLINTRSIKMNEIQGAQANVPMQNNEAELEKLRAEKAQMAKELSKMKAIDTYSHLVDDDFVAELKAMDISGDEVKDKIMDKIAQDKKSINAVVGEDIGKKTLHADTQDALSLAMGANIANASEKSRQLADCGFKAILANFGGLNYTNNNQDFMATMTSGDFPILLNSSINRTLEKLSYETPSTYQKITKVEVLKDFNGKMVAQRGNVSPNAWRKTGEKSEATNVSVEESSYNLKTQSYQMSFELTREMLINDDLGAFNDFLAQIARSHRRRMEIDAYSFLTSKDTKLRDGKGIFDATHNNIMKTKGVPNKDTLSEGRIAIRKMTDKFGDKMGLSPKYLIIPPELQTDTEILIKSLASIENGQNSNVVNVFNNAYEIIVVDELENADEWYLSAENPLLLNVLAQTKGKPLVEQVYKSAIDGIKYKAVSEWAFDMIEYQRIVKFSVK